MSDGESIGKGKVLVRVNYTVPMGIDNFFFDCTVETGYVIIGSMKYPVSVRDDVLSFDEEFLKKHRLNGESRFIKKYEVKKMDGMDCIEVDDSF